MDIKLYPFCKGYLNCFTCRNDDIFRKKISKNFEMSEGFECPMSFKIGCSLEELPEETQENEKKIKDYYDKEIFKAETVKRTIEEMKTLKRTDEMDSKIDTLYWVLFDQKLR